MLATALAEAAQARGRRGAAVLAAAGGDRASPPSTSASRRAGRSAATRTRSKLGPRVGGVPLLAGAAWAMMARPAWVVGGLLAPRRALRVPLAAGALTAWDVFLDPRMARDGLLDVAGGGRYEGMPASNFAGWFATGLGVVRASGAASTATTTRARPATARSRCTRGRGSARRSPTPCSGGGP